MKTRIIGCGNSPAQDDSPGILAIRELKKISLPEEVEVVEAATPGLTLLSLLEGVDRAIILDAFLSGLEPPGTIHRFRGEHLPPKSNFPGNAHGLHWVEALQMALMVGSDKATPEILILGIEAEKTAPGVIGLGECRERAIRELVARILEELGKNQEDSRS